MKYRKEIAFYIFDAGLFCGLGYIFVIRPFLSILLEPTGLSQVDSWVLPLCAVMVIAGRVALVIFATSRS